MDRSPLSDERLRARRKITLLHRQRAHIDDTDMLAVGEQAGDMPASLEHIGKRYQKDMDRNITAFTNALEPILIVMIAGAVGFVAIAILMAVFQVSSSLG